MRLLDLYFTLGNVKDTKKALEGLEPSKSIDQDIKDCKFLIGRLQWEINHVIPALAILTSTEKRALSAFTGCYDVRDTSYRRLSDMKRNQLDDSQRYKKLNASYQLLISISIPNLEKYSQQANTLLTKCQKEHKSVAQRYRARAAIVEMLSKDDDITKRCREIDVNEFAIIINRTKDKKRQSESFVTLLKNSIGQTLRTFNEPMINQTLDNLYAQMKLMEYDPHAAIVHVLSVKYGINLNIDELTLFADNIENIVPVLVEKFTDQRFYQSIHLCQLAALAFEELNTFLVEAKEYQKIEDKKYTPDEPSRHMECIDHAARVLGTLVKRNSDYVMTIENIQKQLTALPGVMESTKSTIEKIKEEITDVIDESEIRMTVAECGRVFFEAAKKTADVKYKVIPGGLTAFGKRFTDQIQFCLGMTTAMREYARNFDTQPYAPALMYIETRERLKKENPEWDASLYTHYATEADKHCCDLIMPTIRMAEMLFRSPESKDNRTKGTFPT